MPTPNLLYKLNENIILPGTYPWRLNSKEIKPEFLNVLRTYLLKTKASLFFSLLKLETEFAYIGIKVGPFPHGAALIEQSLLTVYLWPQNINSFTSPAHSMHSSLLNLTHYHCFSEMWLLFFLTKAESSFLFPKSYFLTISHTRKLKWTPFRYILIHKPELERRSSDSQSHLDLLYYSASFKCWSNSWGNDKFNISKKCQGASSLDIFLCGSGFFRFNVLENKFC